MKKDVAVVEGQGRALTAGGVHTNSLTSRRNSSGLPICVTPIPELPINRTSESFSQFVGIERPEEFRTCHPGSCHRLAQRT